MKKYKKLIDQEIQEALDGKSSSLAEHIELNMDEDVGLYRSLFENLEHEPGVYLGDDFSKKVVEISIKRKNVQDLLWKIVLYAIVSIPLVALSIIITILMDSEVFWRMIGSLKENSTYLMYGVIVFTIIQILDKILIQNKLPDTEA